MKLTAYIVTLSILSSLTVSSMGHAAEDLGKYVTSMDYTQIHQLHMYSESDLLSCRAHANILIEQDSVKYQDLRELQALANKRNASVWLNEMDESNPLGEFYLSSRSTEIYSSAPNQRLYHQDLLAVALENYKKNKSITGEEIIKAMISDEEAKKLTFEVEVEFSASLKTTSVSQEGIDKATVLAKEETSKTGFTYKYRHILPSHPMYTNSDNSSATWFTKVRVPVNGLEVKNHQVQELLKLKERTGGVPTFYWDSPEDLTLFYIQLKLKEGPEVSVEAAKKLLNNIRNCK